MDRVAYALVLVWFAVRAASGQPSVRNFDADRPGALPGGFELATLRQERPGTWLVHREEGNGWLAHRADPSASGFALALAPDPPLRDVEASVRLRLAGTARAGGLVWRYVDAGQYYAAVLDLAQQEIVLFRVTAGNRVILEVEDGLELDAAAWHTLKVVHDESRIAVSLGGIRVFEERDRGDDRHFTPGRSGVIAAGAADVWFDDLRIAPDRERRR
jgi:hypothetical protein